MAITDPIADMLTRIRNGLTARHESVLVPASKVKMDIANILAEEGYVKSATLEEKKEGEACAYIKIELKYGPNYSKVITGLKRISRPGLRIYAKKDELPKVLNGLGIAIISTSKGIMTDKKARAIGAGGEVLAFVW